MCAGNFFPVCGHLYIPLTTSDAHACATPPQAALPDLTTRLELLGNRAAAQLHLTCTQPTCSSLKIIWEKTQWHLSARGWMGITDVISNWVYAYTPSFQIYIFAQINCTKSSDEAKTNKQTPPAVTHNLLFHTVAFHWPAKSSRPARALPYPLLQTCLHACASQLSAINTTQTHQEPRENSIQSISFKRIMKRNCFLSKCPWNLKPNKHADDR